MINAKADCLRLVEILDDFPLRGRKSREYAIWRAAVQWWVDGDPTARRPNRAWDCMAYLSSRLKEAKRYGSSTCPDYTIDPPGLEPDWTAYLAGFITAEGHLGLHDGGGGPKPRLSVRTRADDRGLLTELCRRTAVGRVYTYPPRSGDVNATSVWQVFSFSDLARTVELLDEVAPRGRKVREYEIWRDAVGMVGRGAHRTPAGRARLTKLAMQIRVARAYSPA